jgi:hypothetical protein
VEMIDQVIEAAEVKGREGTLYCLGPFPRRVSFSAQHTRAMNLVWALKQRGRFKSTDAIAVVGAGLAGLAAASAFMGFGCRVDVYEAGALTMSRQRATDHRLIHPTINRWPEKPLSLTTQLPLLEWYMGTCSAVTESIHEQFEHIRGQNRLFTEHQVLDVMTIATDLVHLNVEPVVQGRPTYSLVLLATGFGVEDRSEDFSPSSYWYPDGLEARRNTGGGKLNFIISGCGDGGLIDALRVVHLDFRKGMLAFDVAAELSDTPLADGIRAGEERARSASNPDLLKETYENAAHLLETDPTYAAVKAKLHRSLRPSGVVIVTDNQLSAPYSLYAAPIHKLLIAHAIRSGTARFLKGVVRRDAGKILVASDHFDAEPNSHVIVRHGANMNFGRLLTPKEVAELESKQRHLSDHHVDPIWAPELYPVPAGHPNYDPKSAVFMKHRKKLAGRAVLALSQDAHLNLTPDGYRVEYEGAVPINAPEQLFGVAVQNVQVPSSPGILG